MELIAKGPPCPWLEGKDTLLAWNPRSVPFYSGRRNPYIGWKDKDAYYEKLVRSSTCREDG